MRARRREGWRKGNGKGFYSSFDENSNMFD
jgi:hypothetical protein